MCDLVNAWPCLQVAFKQDDKGAEIIEYSYVWTGSNGQQSRCSFLQGSEASLLPPDGYRKLQLTAIIFSSVQLKGSTVGKARFKIKDSEESGEVGNAAVGHRLISAYLLQSGLTTEDDIATAFSLVKGPRRRTSTQKPIAQPVIRAAVKVQRAKSDAWHDQACSTLAQHAEWYEVCSEVSEEGQRAHSIIKLSAAADCTGFGKAKYTALKKRRWKLCHECPGIFADMKRLERHTCAAPEEAAVPVNSEPPAAAAAKAAPAPASASARAPAASEYASLPGGLYVQTTVPQVTFELFSRCQYVLHVKAGAGVTLQLSWYVGDLCSLICRFLKRRPRAPLLGLSALQSCIACPLMAEHCLTVKQPALLDGMVAGQMLTISRL